MNPLNEYRSAKPQPRRPWRAALASIRSAATRLLALACVSALALAACNKEQKPPVPVTAPSAGTGAAPSASGLPSMEVLSQGARLYEENCAQCHGPEAEGHPDWQNPNFAAAPPLNGTGNDWKRSKADMVAIIQNGASRNGEPVMPGWKGRLSDADIEAIIIWYQALWPADVYERWQKANTADAQPKG